MTDTLMLDANRFARLDGATALHVTRGTLWLTVDGDPDDHLLERGDEFVLPRGSHGLVQALQGPAKATVDRPTPWWRPAIRAWRHVVHEAAAR